MSEAFKKEYENTAKVSKGLKLNNKKSSVQKVADESKHSEEEFKAKAFKLIQEQKDNNAKMVSLSSTLLKLIDDKTLVRNKSETAKEVERETRMMLAKLALEMDNDESISEMNVGVTAVLQVLLRCLFIMRDRMNEQEYQFSLMEKDLKFILSKI